MKSDRIQKYRITLFCSLLAIALTFAGYSLFFKKNAEKKITVGFIYVGDLSDAYTSNFAKAQMEIEALYGEQTETIIKYNVSEDVVEEALMELADMKCDLIFSTSYGYGEKTKEYAQKYPQIQFCQATCSNANEEPYLSNYHTFMGSIYEGRYISGVVAGLKLDELIKAGKLTTEQAKIGYIGAYPYAEVISGYTAFFLGVRSVVPEAVMVVRYTDTWGNYHLEKTMAEELIGEGCVIIAQHSDTAGPAAACEETEREREVYYVSYNESMRDIAPTTYLTGSKINWNPYMVSAVKAVLKEKPIEKCVKGNVNGNDVGSGFENGWVEMLEINEFIAADGTQEKVEELINGFRQNKIQVFQGDYIGVNPQNPEDRIDLKNGFRENEKSSAPSFCYVLEDVITIE